MPAFAAEYVACPIEPCSPAPDEVLMTRATRWRPSLASARQYAPACRSGAKWPLRCTRMTASHSSSEVLTSIRSRTNPALLTRMSSPPNVSIACWTIAAAASKSATSAPLTTASPPIASISATTWWAGDSPVSSPASETP